METGFEKCGWHPADEPPKDDRYLSRMITTHCLILGDTRKIRRAGRIIPAMRMNFAQVLA